MTSSKTYKKKGTNEEVLTYEKFIYLSSVYKFWENGFSLVEEKYYSSDKPLSLKKKDRKKQIDKNTYLYRYLELEFAPEEWLINNGYYEAESN